MTDRQPIIVGDGTILIPLTRGLFATIDEADLPLVAERAWHAAARSDGNGFYARSSDRKKMHRIILGLSDDLLGDHRDGDGLNNRRSNLRAANRKNNAHNSRLKSEPKERGFKEIRGRFYARIRDSGKEIALGGFGTKEAANAAYRSAASRLRGEWLSPDLLPRD